MRKDMTQVISKGGNAGKFHPFLGRHVEKFRPHNDVHFSLIDRDFDGYPTGEILPQLRSRDGVIIQAGDFLHDASPAPTYVDFEPVEIGRVTIRKDRDRGHNVTRAPLNRWLAAQVGRPWSEVRAELSSKHVPGLYGSLKEWITDRVAEKCFRSGDALYFCTRHCGVQEVGWNDFYVDPNTGILHASVAETHAAKEKRLRKQREADRAKVFRKGPGDLQYHKREGIWYEVKVASFSEAYKREAREENFFNPNIRDTFRKCRRSCYELLASYELYGNSDLYAASHKALGGRQAKKLGLH